MDEEHDKTKNPIEDTKNEPVKREIVWKNVLFFIYLHMLAVYGLVVVCTQAHLATIIFTGALILMSTMSVTLGCHRLWTHGAYEGNFLIRLLFIVGHTLTCQGPVYDWVMDHKIHHKYHGTEFDPYNYRNGFVYAQLTCRLLSKHPQWEKMKREVDMTDIETDNLVMWQKMLYWWLLMPLLGIYVPVYLPIEYFHETATVSIFVVYFLRLAITLHIAWLINSAVVIWGLDPLNKTSVDTYFIFLVNKSLWPYYHYLVPWDYQVGEYGNYGDGFCNAISRILAAIGCIYNLRTIDANGVRKALYESVKLGKDVPQSLRQHQLKPSFDDMTSYQHKSRI